MTFIPGRTDDLLTGTLYRNFIFLQNMKSLKIFEFSVKFFLPRLIHNFIYLKNVKTCKNILLKYFEKF